MYDRIKEILFLEDLFYELRQFNSIYYIGMICNGRIWKYNQKIRLEKAVGFTIR